MDELSAVKAVVGAAIFIGLIALVATSITGQVPDAVDGAEFEPAPVDEVAYELDQPAEGNISVTATQGNAAAIQTLDGYIDLPANLSADEWTIAITADLNSSVPTANATYAVAGWNNGTTALWLDDGDWFAKHNDSGAVSYARVPASDPTNDSTLTLDYSAANVLTVNASGVSSTSASKTNRSVAVSWQGQLDEWRAWENGTTAGAISQYHADPVAASPDEPDARVAFHEGSGSQATVYYAGETATLVRAGWGDGVDGPGLTEGVDYETTSTGAGTVGIVPLPGGYLDGQPFAFVSSDGAASNFMSAVTDPVNSTLSVLVVVLLMIAVAPIYERISAGGGR